MDNCSKIIDHITENLQELDQKFSSPNSPDSLTSDQDFESSVLAIFKCIDRDLENLHMAVSRVPNPKQEHFYTKFNQLTLERTNHYAIFQTLKSRKKYQRDCQKNRDELLGSLRKLKNGDCTIEFNEEVMIGNSIQHLQNSMEIGTYVLDSLKNQGNLMKKVQYSMMNMVNKLGLSSTIVEKIFYRGESDKKLFYSLCAAVVLFIFLLYRYF